MSSNDAGSPARIRLRTLGRTDVVDSGGAVVGELTQRPKLLALLAFIAIEGRNRAVGVDEACALFWPDTELARAKKSLTELLRTARHRAGLDAVERVRGRLTLRAHVLACDAAELLHDDVGADWVLEHYRGELLPGLSGASGDTLDDWLDRTRARLRAKAVERLVDAAAAAAAPTAALRPARRALELDPYSDKAALLMVQTLGSLRGPAAAWRFFEEHRTRLQTDLDLDPPAALVRAVMQACSADLAFDDISELPTSRDPRTSHDPATSRDPALSREPPLETRRARRWIRHAALAGAVVLALTAAVLQWVRPDRVAAGRNTEPVADIAIADLPGDAVWQSIVSPELSRRLSERGMRVVRRRGDSGRGVSPSIAPFALAGELRAVGDSLYGLVRLEDGATRVLLGSWRVDVASSDLRGRLATIGDSMRTTMGRATAHRSIRGAERRPDAIAALLSARTRLDLAADAAHAAAFTVARTELRLADSLALAAIALEPTWAQPHLLRAEMLERDALLHLSSGDRPMAQAMIVEAIDAAARAVEHGADAAGYERRGGLYYLAWILAAPLPVDAFPAATTDLGRATRAGTATAHSWAMLSAVHHAAGRMADADVAARNALAADVFGRHTENILVRLFSAAFNGGRDADARHWCGELQRRSAGRAHAAECLIATLAWSGDAGSRTLEALDLSLAGEAPHMARIMRPRLELMRAAAYASNGDRERAVAISDSVLALGGSDSELPHYAAMVHAQLGQLDSTRGLLNRYFAGGGPARRAVLHRRWFRPLQDAAGSVDAVMRSFSDPADSTTPHP